MTKRTFILFALVGFLAASCSRNNNENKVIKYFCDLETLSDDSTKYICSDNDNYLGGTKNLNTELAFSGKNSVKINKESPFAMQLNISHLREGDYFRITVWRHKDSKTGVLVASGEKGSNFFQSSKTNIIKSKKNWEQLLLEFCVPISLNVRNLKIYVWNPDKTKPAYFDDLRVVQEQKTFETSFSEKALQILIDEKGMNKLHAKRDDAFKRGVLISDDADWVKAKLCWGEDTLKASIRLKGDWLDHLKGEKWSFRIKMKKNHSWKNLRTFSIQKPETRYFMNEWFVHMVCEKEDLLTSDYGFVPVVLNGNSLGVYAFEEHFEKQLVESRNRREGPILKFSEEVFWEVQRKHKETTNYYVIPYFEASEILPFKRNKTLQSENLYQQFVLAQNLVYSYKYNYKNASNIFDIETMAKYLAIMDVFKSYHGLAWHNQRFYYNPVLSRIEPILFDGCTGANYAEWNTKKFIGAYSSEDINKNRKDLASVFALLKDKKLYDRYFYYLRKYSERKYISELINSLSEGITENELLLQKEYSCYSFNEDLFVQSAKTIHDELQENDFPYEDKYSFLTSDLLEQAASHFNKEPGSFFAPLLTNVYTENENTLRIFNFFPNNLEILGTGTDNKNISSRLSKPKIVDSYYNSDKYDQSISTNNATHVFFREKGKKETFSVEARPWPSPSTFNPATELLNLYEQSSKKYYNLSGNTITFSGKHIINDFVVIPEGYKVKFLAGTDLDFINKAGFISYSPVEIIGSKNKAVLINSSDKSAQGFSVFQSQEKSQVTHCIFTNMNTLNYKGWTLTGGVNFYESDVIINNTEFNSNHCEDALNIIRSEFEINHCAFFNTFSDAFDSDFCIGTIKNTKFIKPGNDGADFSGSDVIIRNTSVENAGDKGISVGEKSTAKIYNCSVIKSNIGIAAKDLSKAEIFSTKIKDCNYGIAAYRKKPEYGKVEIITKDIELKNNKSKYIIEKKSVLILNGKIIKGDKKKVYTILSII